MGPGFESQRDHKKKLNRKIELFFVPTGIRIIFRRHPYWVRFREGSGFEPGDCGAEQIPAGSSPRTRPYITD